MPVYPSLLLAIHRNSVVNQHDATMILAFVRPVRLEHLQHRRLDALLHQLTDVWNAASQERIECFRKTGEFISYYDQCKSMTVIRGGDESFATFPVPAQHTPLNRHSQAVTTLGSGDILPLATAGGLE